MKMCLAALMTSLMAATATTNATRPHIVFFLQDDLGHHNVAFNADRTDLPSADVAAVSGHISTLARQGIILDRHYTHWHCSPTRRSLLTGRTPLHHTELLSSIDSDDIDLRWTTLGQKLTSVGYTSYWFGKGHTGYMSMAHLPTRQGFASFTGFLSGAMAYHGKQRWRDEEPFHNESYSTDLYGEAAVAALAAHNASTPLFMYLPFQAVHTPYTAPPGYNHSQQRCDGYENACVLYGMLHTADEYVGRLTSLLHTKGMWPETLVVYSADNGGVTAGVNYPFRGEKHTNWEGGMRVAAFASGGFIPPSLRGTTSNLIMHIADWYPTLCSLAGASPSDDPPVPPLPVDAAEPHRDIYANGSFPPVDGVDVWPMLMRPSMHNESAAHPVLWLSKEVLLYQQYKLLVAQPSPDTMSARSLHSGWKLPNGTWISGNPAIYGCEQYKVRTDFRNPNPNPDPSPSPSPSPPSGWPSTRVQSRV